MDERDEAQKVRDKLTAAVDRIRADANLSAVGRWEAVNTAYSGSRSQMDALRAAWLDRRYGEDRNLIQSLMSTSFPATASPEARLAMIAGNRDALERVSAVAEHHGVAGVLELLQRADRIGDKQLGRACFTFAVEQTADADALSQGKWRPVLDAFLTLYPDKRAADALDQLRQRAWATPSQRANERFAWDAAFSLSQPVEVTQMRPVA